MIWWIREVAIMESLIAKGQLLEVEYKMAPKMDYVVQHTLPAKRRDHYRSKYFNSICEMLHSD